jgi:hypothetical protein
VTKTFKSSEKDEIGTCNWRNDHSTHKKCTLIRNLQKYKQIKNKSKQRKSKFSGGGWCIPIIPALERKAERFRIQGQPGLPNKTVSKKKQKKERERSSMNNS